jgi:hypothetical protein
VPAELQAGHSSRKQLRRLAGDHYRLGASSEPVKGLGQSEEHAASFRALCCLKKGGEAIGSRLPVAGSQPKL